VERACGSSAGRRPSAIDPGGQTDQCGFSDRSLDPACQHHDAGARCGTVAIRAASGGAGCERAVAVTAADIQSHIGGGQKAGGAETSAPGSAGSGRTHRTGASE
jgi:hypothetical protein